MAGNQSLRMLLLGSIYLIICVNPYSDSHIYLYKLYCFEYRFGGDLEKIPVLLDILTVLPEEVQNQVLQLGGNRRNVLRELIGGQSGNVLELLSVCIQHWPANYDIQTRVRDFRSYSLFLSNRILY